MLSRLSLLKQKVAQATHRTAMETMRLPTTWQGMVAKEMRKSHYPRAEAVVDRQGTREEYEAAKKQDVVAAEERKLGLVTPRA